MVYEEEIKCQNMVEENWLIDFHAVKAHGITESTFFRYALA